MSCEPPFKVTYRRRTPATRRRRVVLELPSFASLGQGAPADKFVPEAADTALEPAYEAMLRVAHMFESLGPRAPPRCSPEAAAAMEAGSSRLDTIGVVGGGAWGTALADTMQRAGRRTVLWAREPEVVAEINAQHTNA